MAAPNTVAGVPPTVTDTGLSVVYVLSEGICAPNGADFAGPKPVPQRMITSPGLAAVVVTPSKVPFLTANVKSWRVATGYFPAHRKNAGAIVVELTVEAALVPPELLTVTDIVPVPTSGATALIWVGLTK